MTETTPELGTKDSPLYYKLIRDEEGNIRWGRMLIMLGFAVAYGYLSTRSQRMGASAINPVATARLAVAQKEISLGYRLQKAGRVLEEHGWETYTKIRPAG
jgi:hypothetical protein